MTVKQQISQISQIFHTEARLPYTSNNMAANDLATQGANSAATMELNSLFRHIPDWIQETWIFKKMSMWKSILIKKNFLIHLLISGQHNRQPIRSHMEKLCYKQLTGSNVTSLSKVINGSVLFYVGDHLLVYTDNGIWSERCILQPWRFMLSQWQPCSIMQQPCTQCSTDNQR